MVQGDASVYPILPISLGIVAFCMIASFLISFLADYIYDLYLLRFADESYKPYIQKRVKADLTRIKNFFKSQKIEKFDRDEAKNRLTIISGITHEKINSKENRPFLDAVKEKQQQKENGNLVKPKKENSNKVAEISEISKPTEKKLSKPEEKPNISTPPPSIKEQKQEIVQAKENEVTKVEQIKVEKTIEKPAVKPIEIKKEDPNHLKTSKSIDTKNPSLEKTVETVNNNTQKPKDTNKEIANTKVELKVIEKRPEVIPNKPVEKTKPSEKEIKKNNENLTKEQKINDNANKDTTKEENKPKLTVTFSPEPTTTNITKPIASSTRPSSVKVKLPENEVKQEIKIPTNDEAKKDELKSKPVSERVATKLLVEHATVVESFKTKNIELEPKRNDSPLSDKHKLLTVEEAMKKLSKASKSSIIYIEIKEFPNKSSESTSKTNESKSSDFQKIPIINTPSTVASSDKASVEQIYEKPRKRKSPSRPVSSKSDKPVVRPKSPKPSLFLQEVINKNNPRLPKNHREQQMNLLHEGLKLEAQEDTIGKSGNKYYDDSYDSFSNK